jgi:hypothetical protein
MGMSVYIAEAIALADARLQAERPAETRTRAGLFIADPSVAPRSITSLMIICGNCAGDHQNPRKTLLTKDGNCSACGGGSYVLASKFFGGFYEHD